VLILLHYAKRELETLLCVLLSFESGLLSCPQQGPDGRNFLHFFSVHRFSSATMPFFNIFKKCALSLPISYVLLTPYGISAPARVTTGVSRAFCSPRRCTGPGTAPPRSRGPASSRTRGCTGGRRSGRCAIFSLFQ
jgi:hypothetical protein